jgi:IS4 transposase
MRGTLAVPHQNTVFRQLTNQLPWAALDRLIAETGADAGVRRFGTKDLLLTLLFAQFSGAKSLRDIEAFLASQAAQRYHSGLRAVHRSTLADAAASRPVAVFTGVLSLVMASLARRTRQKLADCVRLIDSTSIRLNRLSEDWSRFSARLCGVKAHVVYDPTAGCPLYLGITPARVNDITAAKAMPIEPGATYVFDLGYYDYGWWAALDEACCRLVTRLKKNTPLTVIEDLPVPADEANILSDRIGFLPDRLADSRRNPMQGAVREIRVRLDTGKVLRIVSNDLDAPASQIAALYKRRWDIELFFRWIKQMLKLTHFFGTSENAVRIQIAVVLIAFVLLRLAHGAQSMVAGLTEFARTVGTIILLRRRLDRLRRQGNEVEPVPTVCVRQLTLLAA